MNLLNLTIDNKHVKVAAGTTVLAAAKSVGIYIPTLCSHPDLTPAALEIPNKEVYQKGNKIDNVYPKKSAKSCGICIVEIQGKKELLSSCTAQVMAGMIVTTDSKKIKKERKKNLIPILSKHKHACLTCAQQEGCSQTQCSSNVPENERCCSKFGNCELRKLVSYVGISDNTPKWIPSSFPVVTNEPLFKIDYNLCIGCIRCVRACNKLRGVGAIGFVWNNQGHLQVGNTSETLIKSGCKFCTACVEVCPTGALQDKFISTGKKEEDIVPCKAVCPVHINIPEYLRMISLNKFDDANTIIREKVPFPRILGRICMHPCEDVCRRKEVNSSISICALKKFVSDECHNHNKNQFHKKNVPFYETGKKIAIIGAGPAGLSASFYLRKKGHKIILYDEKSKAGGMLRYGIPEYRLPLQVLNDEINSILDTGIEFRPNNTLGVDFELSDLKNDGFDAILLAIGVQNDRKIDLEGVKLDGVNGGINFLHSVSEDKNIKIGKKIVVIGGGNVAIDVAMTAVRCGAKHVSIVCLEADNEMPANPWEIETAISEGIEILPSWAPKKIVGKNGKVSGIDVVKCICVSDKKGNFSPKCDDTITKNIKADQILMAVGQEANLKFLNLTSISTKNGFIIVDKNTFETTSSGIYSAGDVISMPGSVITAVASGKKAAKGIDIALGGNGIIDDEISFNELENDNYNYIGCNKGFAERFREKQYEINVKERHNNFKEIVLGFTKNQALREASRCLQCDLRLNLDKNVSPPVNKLFPLTTESLDLAIPDETEGVYKLYDENKTIIAIMGSSTLRNDLISSIDNNKTMFFEFEKNKMYSKRESELIQKHLQEYGEMPGGNDDMDDLF